jgi:hypothetical protein
MAHLNCIFHNLFNKNLIAHKFTVRHLNFSSRSQNIFLLLQHSLMYFFRLRQHSIERAMDLTDSFTWEDLPNRDADSGHLTAAGWIRLIKFLSMRVSPGIITFHFIQSTVRIVTNHETILIVWYPFDWTVSPFYELVNISQVTISKTKFPLIYVYSIIALADCVN